MASLAHVMVGSHRQTLKMMGYLGVIWPFLLDSPLGEPRNVAFFAVCYVVGVSAVTGDSLRVSLSSARARTVPALLISTTIQIQVAAYLISGATLIGLSYYRWCSAEIA